jgi:hypothetical protein
MARKHRKTYDALFSEPVRANISWNDAVASLAAAGCTVKPLRGSIFEARLGDERLIIHLDLLGINPDDL